MTRRTTFDDLLELNSVSAQVLPPQTAAEIEWARWQISKLTCFRLIAARPLDARDVGFVIKLLRAQLEILEESDQDDASTAGAVEYDSWFTKENATD
jgi:hypothetical protein